MSGQISLSEVKFAIADLLLEEIGLPAQKIVDAVESATSLQAVKQIVIESAKKPIIANKPRVIEKLKVILVKS